MQIQILVRILVLQERKDQIKWQNPGLSFKEYLWTVIASMSLTNEQNLQYPE